MTLKNTSILILTLLVMFACKTKSKPLQDPNINVKNGISSFKDGAKYEKVIKQIDGNKSLIQIRSLLYTNDEGKTQSVSGLIDKNGEILKLSQEYSDGKGIKVILDFYFENRRLICTLNKTLFVDDKRGYCREIKSYYIENDMVVYCCSRKAKDEESIASLNFRTDKKYSFKIDEALEILNQKGRFETRFQSFMSIGGKEFIIVSAIGKDPYYSVLAVQPDDKAIQMLKKNEGKFLNKLLKVEFVEITESNGFSFQGLTNVKMIEE